MAPTKQTSQKPFQSTTADPPRRSTRASASGISPPSQRVPIQCTWTNCTATTMHSHPLSKDPEQHFLPRPEYAVESVGFADPERGSPSQQFDSAQISTTRSRSQSTIQRGPRITKNTQMKSRVVQKVTKSKCARARTIGKKTRARDRADAREQRARQQVQQLIEDAETAARLHDTDHVTAIDEGTAVELLPCSDGRLNVTKQLDINSAAIPRDDPQTPIHQTSEKQLTSPPAVSRSPQYKHHGSYMEFQGSPLGSKGSLRCREPEVKPSSDDILVEEESNLNDSDQALIDQAPKAEVSSMDGIAVPHASLQVPEDLHDEVESLAGSFQLSEEEGDGLTSNVVQVGIICEPPAGYNARLDDLLTRPRTSGMK